MQMPQKPWTPVKMARKKFCLEKKVNPADKEFGDNSQRISRYFNKSQSLKLKKSQPPDCVEIKKSIVGKENHHVNRKIGRSKHAFRISMKNLGGGCTGRNKFF